MRRRPLPLSWPRLAWRFRPSASARNAAVTLRAGRGSGSSGGRCRDRFCSPPRGQNPELVGEGPQKPLCHSALLGGADHAPAA
jgi:hypothetical protein